MTLRARLKNLEKHAPKTKVDDTRFKEWMASHAKFIRDTFPDNKRGVGENAALLLVGTPDPQHYIRWRRGESDQVLAQEAYGDDWQSKQENALQASNQLAVIAHGENWFEKYVDLCNYRKSGTGSS